jgi:hypothetical protein
MGNAPDKSRGRLQAVGQVMRLLNGEADRGRSVLRFVPVECIDHTEDRTYKSDNVFYLNRTDWKELGSPESIVVSVKAGDEA